MKKSSQANLKEAFSCSHKILNFGQNITINRNIMVTFSNFALLLVSLPSVLSDAKTTSLRGRGKRNLGDLTKCPFAFDTVAMEETVAQANSRDIWLTDCSCHEYNDGTTTSFGLNYVDSSLGYHGWQVSSNVETKTYDYFITDMGFGFESKEEYDACLQILHNQCGALRNGVFQSIKCPW